LDAHGYAELINRVLSTFHYLENKPHFPYPIEIPESNPQFLRFKADILLQNDLCLSVNETAIFDEDGIAERSFSYDFRNINTNKMTWRIDNHGQRQSIDCPCHVHPNPEDEKQRNECFQDSKTTIFPYAIGCVRKFYEEEHQDWEVNPNE
jgi:hypothetical protein